MCPSGSNKETEPRGGFGERERERERERSLSVRKFLGDRPPVQQSPVQESPVAGEGR